MDSAVRPSYNRPKDFWVSHLIEVMLKDFADENFECKFYTDFLRPNQEQNYWLPRTCDSGAAF